MSLSAIETIRQLQFLGRSLSSDGKQLAVGDGGEISADLMEAIRCHREELIRLFTPPAGDPEREAIQWADRTPNAEADASLAAFVAELGSEASPFLTAAAKAFPGCRMRPLSQAEYEAIGFADSRAKANAEPQAARHPTARRGEWLTLASEIELRIDGVPTVINAGEGVRRIVTLDEIADGFDLDSMRQAAEHHARPGMVAVWVRGKHPAYVEPELLGLVAATSPTEAAA